MLGKNHAAFGVAAWARAAWVIPHHTNLHPLVVPQILVGTVVAAGAALAPDLDEKHSLSGRVNPLSWLPIFGKHRSRTHYLFTVMIVTVGAVICQTNPDATGVLVSFAACSGGVLVNHRWGPLMCIPFGIGVGVVTALFVGGGWWLPAAIAAPYISHLIGDAMTPYGVPFLGPFSKKCYSLHLFRTGGSGEKWIVTPLVHGLAVLALYEVFSPTVAAIH